MSSWRESLLFPRYWIFTLHDVSMLCWILHTVVSTTNWYLQDLIPATWKSLPTNSLSIMLDRSSATRSFHECIRAHISHSLSCLFFRGCSYLDSWSAPRRSVLPLYIKKSIFAQNILRANLHDRNQFSLFACFKIAFQPTHPIRQHE